MLTKLGLYGRLQGGKLAYPPETLYARIRMITNEQPPLRLEEGRLRGLTLFMILAYCEESRVLGEYYRRVPALKLYDLLLQLTEVLLIDMPDYFL